MPKLNNINDKIEKLLQQKKKILAKESQNKRARENKLKYIIGGLITAEAQNNKDLNEMLRSLVQKKISDLDKNNKHQARQIKDLKLAWLFFSENRQKARVEMPEKNNNKSITNNLDL